MSVQRKLAAVAEEILCRRSLYPVNRALYLVALRGLGCNTSSSGDPISKPEKRFLRNFFSSAPDQAVVVDVGAHDCEYGRVVRAFCPNARVLAFEANPIRYVHTERAAAELGIESFNLGCGRCSEVMALYDVTSISGSPFASFHSAALEFLDKANGRGFQKVADVNVVALDDFLDDRNISHIDLVKIDTEGHELEILKGLSRRLARGDIRAIQVEINYANAFSRVFVRDFFELLPGYTLHRILTTGELLPLDYDPKMCEIFSYQNIVALRECGSIVGVN